MTKAKISPEMTRFQAALGHVMSVSKEELKRREAEYQKENEGKPKRGPKPKTSASGRVSRDA
jgi:uncharacterized protein (DUF4415 family)